MRNRFYFIIVLLFISCSSTFSKGLTVDNLLCEHLANPLGVDASHPVLSWTVKSSDRNVVQTFYRILVATNQETLKRNEGDVWDSGFCSTNNSINIPYEGKDLQSGQCYYWKVMVKDNHGNVSNWSRQAVFRMGLLNDIDWSGARWIAYDTIPLRYHVVPGYQTAGGTITPLVHEPVMPQFRKAFTLQGKKVKSAIAYICGLGQFKMTVNGVRVGDHFLDPAWTKYDKTSQYVTFDITSLMQKGENVLGVQLGNGFLHIPRDSSRYIKLITTFSAPKLICKVQVTYSDGSQEDIISDDSWKVTASPVTFSSVYGGEDYDARKELEGWDASGYDDANWSTPIVIPAVGRLQSQFQHPVKVKQVNRQVRYWESRPGVYIYDFGQNASAIVSLRVSGPSGSRVTMRPAEYLTDDGLANQNNSGTPYYFSYTLKGRGTESWSPAFSYYGFRYVQVEGAVPMGVRNPNGLPVIKELTQLHVSSDSRAVGKFECSNDLFNRICRLIDWSVKSNLMHVMTDCPHREKLGWLEQTHLMGPSLAFCYDISLLFRKALMDMKDSQTDDGLIPNTAPEYAQFPHDFRDSPEWGSAGVILPWFLYEWYGDKMILSDNYEMMQRYIDYLTTRAKHGLLFHGLGDWYDLGPNHPGYSQLTERGLTPTAFYFRDLQILAKAAGLLGKEKDRQKYEKMASDVRIAFNTRFFDSRKGYYDKGSQTANAIPMYFGIVDDEDRASCIRQIVNDIRSRGNSITSGDIGFAYLLRILEAEGYADVIFDMNSQSEKPGYGYQLKEGATSLTESWSALKTASHNHFMLGHLMEWFYAGIGGIRLDEGSVAFRTFDLRPDIVGDLTYAKVDFKSPLGLISSHWNIRNGKMEYDVTVPIGATAHVWIPCDNVSSILESGRPIEQVTDISVSHPRKGYSILTVGSGNYHFVSPYNK